MHKPHGTESRGDINHDVAKFIGVFQQVEDLQISGMNDNDMLIKAKELYNPTHPKGKSFSFDRVLLLDLERLPTMGQSVGQDVAKEREESCSPESANLEGELSFK